MKRGPVLALVVLGCAAVAGGALWIDERVAVPTPAAETETPATGVPAPPGPFTEPEPGITRSEDPRPGSPENPVRLRMLAFSHPDQLFSMLGIKRDPGPWRQVRSPMDHPDWDIVSKLELGELRQRAETDDYLARHALAWRIGHEQPLEAHDIWRRLAAEGSGFALQRVAGTFDTLHWLDESGRRFANWDEPTRTAASELGRDYGDLELESLAWKLAAEARMGQPRGSIVGMAMLENQEFPTEARVEQACGRAREILEDLEAERQARGIVDPVAGQPPPLYVDVMGYRSYEAACPYDALPAPDLSACRHFVAEVMTMSFSGYACPGR